MEEKKPEFTLDDAIQLAAKAHAGALDKADKPYILHPLRVMMKMQTIKGMMAAVLHDVVEDTELTIEDIRKAGVPYDVVLAVDALTKRKEDGETHLQYIDRIIESGSVIAQQVKIQDILDNTDPRRVQYLPADQRESMLKRYTKSLARLMYRC